MKSATCLAVLVLLLICPTTVLADLGFGLDLGGGVSILNNSRIFEDDSGERSNFIHGDGMGFVVSPLIFAGYRAEAYFIGAEFGFIYSEGTVEYDEYGGEEDYQVRRRADIFRLGPAFNYFFLTGSIRPYVLAGLHGYLIEASLYDHSKYDRELFRFDSSLGAGVSLGFGVDFEVAEGTAVGFGVRADGIFYNIRHYKDRLRDEYFQVPVALYFRLSFDRMY